jgi:very-short-patch-repair endonuclease
MTRRDIITGQRVLSEKTERAQRFRRHQTPAEQALWQRLRANRLDRLHFRRQQVIDSLIVDFYCHSVGLVVEVDGAVHKLQTAADAERDNILQGRGLTVLHVTNDEVRADMEGVLQCILQSVEAIPPSL